MYTSSVRGVVVYLITLSLLGMLSGGVSRAADAPKEDPAVTARAKDWLARLQTGNVDTSQLTPDFAKRMTPEYLHQVSAGLAALGTPSDWKYVGSESTKDGTLYGYKVLLGTATHTWVIVLAPDGKIAGSGMK